MSVQDLALQRDKYRHLSDEEWRWMLQQAEGRERTKDKLPTFAAIDDWWYPVRLSCEQCSSELTARYKAEIVESGETRGERRMVDLTGGYGVDTFFLSEQFEQADYVEQNEELCRIMTHNAALKMRNGKLKIHHTSAETFLETAGKYDLIYLDPARRDKSGSKVYRLEDCTPNVVEMLPKIAEHLQPAGQLMLKLSPMLDITLAMKELTAANRWPTAVDVYVVAVKNEVKEVVVLLSVTKEWKMENGECKITAIDLAKKEQAFRFTREEEMECPSSLLFSPFSFLYEPNVAILKAGAFKLVGQRFGLSKLDTHTHLYSSERLVADFPGRIWKIERRVKDRRDLPAGMTQANILTRNYPLTPEQLKKKLHLRDGGTAYLIGARIQGKPTVMLATLIP